MRKWEGESPLVYLAPAGRHVYRTRHAPNTTKPQRGDMCALSQSQIRPIQRRRERLYLAPAGRYVYSTHGIHKHLKPQRDDMCALSQSRIRPIQRRRERLYLAPAGRHVYSTRHAPNNQSPRGATCTIRLNHGFGGLHG